MQLINEFITGALSIFVACVGIMAAGGNLFRLSLALTRKWSKPE